MSQSSVEWEHNPGMTLQLGSPWKRKVVSLLSLTPLITLSNPHIPIASWHSVPKHVHSFPWEPTCRLLTDIPGSFPMLHPIPHRHPNLGPRCQTSDPTDFPIITCHISTDHLMMVEFGFDITLPLSEARFAF